MEDKSTVKDSRPIQDSRSINEKCTKKGQHLEIQAQFDVILTNSGKDRSANITASSEFRLKVDVQLPGKGITAVFGPSGSGKTSLLRCIAGLIKPDSGYLRVKQEIWQEGRFFLKPYKRNLGYVFQEASLFPHLSVLKNIHYGLTRSSNKPTENEFNKLIELLNLKHLLGRSPETLSGGERQRVAIARALVTQPELLLMDEPLASLDDDLKEQILPYLENLHQTLNIPILYVTHSMQEVTRLADHVVLMHKGRVTKQGDLNQVFTNHYCGKMENIGTIIHGTITHREPRWQLLRFRFADTQLWLSDAGERLHTEYRVRIPAKDVSISLREENQSSILNRIKTKIERIERYQDDATCLVYMTIRHRENSTQQSLVAQITQKSVHELALKPGMQVWAQIKSAGIIR